MCFLFTSIGILSFHLNSRVRQIGGVSLGFARYGLLVDNILLGWFDGSGFTGHWLFGDWLGWHGKEDICPNGG
jgi:hypothetical protein